MQHPARHSVPRMDTASDPMVTPTWLAEHLDAPDIRVVDASWFLPTDTRNATALFAERRIPGAVFFDIDEIADTSRNLPHMLPAPEHFSSRVRKLGIGDGARVIVYDNVGVFSSPRVWWTFRVMGHDDVVVLDGGFPAWEKAGFPVETEAPRTPQERHYTARVRSDLVRDYDDMVRAVGGVSTILDARPTPRFRGDAPEPRAGLSSGHMPGALSVPSTKLVTPEGCLRPAGELRAILVDAGVSSDRPAICTCGSGVTAAIIALALARLGRWDAALYDGAWAEWGARTDAPVATGG